MDGDYLNGYLASASFKLASRVMHLCFKQPWSTLLDLACFQATASCYCQFGLLVHRAADERSGACMVLESVDGVSRIDQTRYAGGSMSKDQVHQGYLDTQKQYFDAKGFPGEHRKETRRAIHRKMFTNLQHTAVYQPDVTPNCFQILDVNYGLIFLAYKPINTQSLGRTVQVQLFLRLNLQIAFREGAVDTLECA
ncbi:hypothetical protein Scep_008143 [Stephania cephalantha]|uniref:Uncharacterized protein n=1 Tax=Stephania cephalantha TaxID=152367 RepID=A0AAP0KB43_9MAGN